MKAARVTTENGFSYVTSINGTDDEIRAYFMGRSINTGAYSDTLPDEGTVLSRVVSVEVIPDEHDQPDEQPAQTQPRGMLCNVFRAASGSDCTNGGISAKASRVILVGKDIPKLFGPDEDTPVLFYIEGKYGPRALTTPDTWDDGSMFGGNFIYSSDSRFPGHTPIRVFDRFEGR